MAGEMALFSFGKFGKLTSSGCLAGQHTLVGIVQKQFDTR
jgi:hypothetical protein